MLRLATGIVMSIRDKKAGMQVLELYMEDSGTMEQALSFSEEEYTTGERLIVNATAVRLDLGTGGYHLVVSKAGDFEEIDVAPTKWGHLMKMRYAPWQLSVDAVEEQSSPFHKVFVREDLTLEGTIVLIGELHSLLPAAAATLRQGEQGLRLVYVMPDGASLPMMLSRHVQHARETGILDATITTGHAWGGDYEAVTIHSGLLAARHVAKADIILCMLGPGVAGTGTPYAFSGVQLAEVIHAVSALGGVPYFIPRISFADDRMRHFGISHHTLSILERFALRPVALSLPILGDDRDELLSRQLVNMKERSSHVIISGIVPGVERLAELEQAYDLTFTTMGRGWEVDPIPFLTAVLAAEQVLQARRYLLGRLSVDPHWLVGPDTLEELCLFLTRNEVLP